MKNKKPSRGAKLDDFLFDDCPICQAMKKAEKEGKNLDGEELLQAFAEANKKTGNLGNNSLKAPAETDIIDPIIQKIEDKFKVPDHVANKVQNIAEKSGNSYILYETRPAWDGGAGPWTKLAVAKISFVKISGEWKLHWMRASGKWNLYGEYKSFGTVLNAIEKDKFGCFWG